MTNNDPRVVQAERSERDEHPAQSNGPAPENTPAAEEKQPERPEPSTPAGEPEAPTGPSRPHGDELEEAVPPTEEPDSDHESEVRVEELAAKAEKADEYLVLAQRTQADFENYRKRAAREAAAAQERGVAKLAKELLPAVDNLNRALEAAQAANGSQDDNTLVSGIKLVHADVIAALSRVGIESFNPKGEQFDPQHHEAIAQQPVEGASPGTVVEVYQCGYRIGESVLRPARVVVAG
jgi:molecular chaperone GrpE